MFRYSGEYWDSETGLQYLRARWYDPEPRPLHVGRHVCWESYESVKYESVFVC
nr:hypothetical protein [Paenibacillus sp. SDF0028]